MQQENNKWLTVHLGLTSALQSLLNGELQQTQKMLEFLLAFSEENCPLEEEKTPFLWLDGTIIDADET